MVFIQAEECVWLKNVAEECGDKHEEPVWYPSIVSVRQRKFFNYVTLGIIILLRFHYITIYMYVTLFHYTYVYSNVS